MHRRAIGFGYFSHLEGGHIHAHPCDSVNARQNNYGSDCKHNNHAVFADKAFHCTFAIILFCKGHCAVFLAHNPGTGQMQAGKMSMGVAVLIQRNITTGSFCST